MIAYQEFSESWALAAFDILRPGGFLLAFGGTRTEHRLACAIEDAGFVIEDKFLWVHSQGFPKGRHLLKPACEVVTIAYRPGAARARQVDECRIPTADAAQDGTTNFAAAPGKRRGGNTTKAWRGAGDRSREQYRTGTTGATIPTDLGRWPTNFSHDGSDEVMAGFPDTPGQLAAVRPDSGTGQKTSGILGKFAHNSDHEPRGDEGSAGRFYYQAKAGREDRWGSKHPTVKPVDLVKHLVALHCPPGGLFLDCFAGSGTAGVAALATGRNAILIEEDAGHIADIRERMAHYEGTGRHSLASKNRNARAKTGTLL